MVFGTTPSLKQPATFCYSHSSENGECGVMGIIVTVFSQVAGFFFGFFCHLSGCFKDGDQVCDRLQ